MAKKDRRLTGQDRAGRTGTRRAGSTPEVARRDAPAARRDARGCDAAVDADAGRASCRPGWRGPGHLHPTAGFTNCARFTYSGGDQTFTVPSGVTSLDVRMWGAGGGGIDPGYFLNQYSGGGGGYTTGTAAVTPGEVLTVTAGRGGVIKGVAPTYGGGGAGGTGGEPGDSGGGMSAVWDGAFGTDPLLIAGGGGGATNGAPTTT